MLTMSVKMPLTPKQMKLLVPHLMNVLFSPMDGKIITLDEVEDKTFSSRAMGDGFAIIPSGKDIFAPVSETLTLAFPTGHAYGIQTDDGKEILIHIGMDTVELDGMGFDCKAKQGQKIKQGDLLCTFDPGYRASSIVKAIQTRYRSQTESVTLSYRPPPSSRPHPYASVLSFLL